MEDMNKVYNNLLKNLQSTGKKMPDFVESFMNFEKIIMADGFLTGKNKELIALSIAVVKRCVGCIAFHTKKALESGAKESEILEAAQVAVLMDGGSALVYMQDVRKALKDYRKK